MALLLAGLALAGTALVLLTRPAAHGDTEPRERTVERSGEGGAVAETTASRGTPDGEAGGAGRAGGRSEVPGAATQAAGPTQRLRVVDSVSGVPLEAVRLLFARDGKVVATTISDGTAALSGLDVSEVVFAREGYLLALCGLGSAELGQAQAQAAAAGTGVLEVRMVRDRFSIPFALRCVGEDGAAVAAVRLRVTCLDEPPPLGGSVPIDRLGPHERITLELREAWQHHQVLAGMTRLGPTTSGRYHFGVQSAATIYECPDGTCTLLLCAAGYYQLEATSADGRVARTTFEAGLAQAEPLVVTLRAGTHLAGRVVDPEGVPVAGAVVSDATPDNGHPQPVVLATSDANGAFRSGPCYPRAYDLEVAHGAFEEQRLAKVRPGGEPLRIVLVPKPRLAVLGVVRARPRLEPLRGIAVRLAMNGEQVATVTTDAAGRFALKVPGSDCELDIDAPGYLRWKELLDPEALGGATVACDLVPAEPAARVAAGLTGLVRGKVLDPGGKPATGVAVLLMPETQVPRIGLPGRRILAGSWPDLRLQALCDADGAFAIEFAEAGTARLVVAGTRVEDSLTLTLAPGQTLSDLALRSPR